MFKCIAKVYGILFLIGFSPVISDNPIYAFLVVILGIIGFYYLSKKGDDDA